jgi:hypothetical protein
MPNTLKYGDNVKNMINSMTAAQDRLQLDTQRKISTDNKEEIPYQEAALYELNDDDRVIYDAFEKYTKGEYVPGFNFHDFLATPQAKILMPQTIIGTMRRAQMVECFVSKLYKEIPVRGSNIIVFPSIGTLRAHDLAEGQEYPEEGLAIQTHQTDTVSILKVGLRVAYTEELLQDAEWPIISIMTEEQGKAMARHKEEKIFYEWRKHGWTVFDNAIRGTHPEAGTTGVDYHNQLNDTLSVDDLLDLIITVMNNEHVPTDLYFHPLVWPLMAFNGMVGSMGAAPESPNASFQLGPGSMQGRLPFAFTVNLSPFAPIDKEAKTYDFFCIDRNNIGEVLMREKLTTDRFTDPRVDIHNVKCRERYGLRTNDQGRGVCMAKNISLARSFPISDRVTEVSPPSHL